MERKEELQILIPQLEKQYGEAHDVFVEKHKVIEARVKEHIGKVIRMYPKDFELHFSENDTQLRFEVNGQKSGELRIYHPTTYTTLDNKPFRLSWYSTSACDVNNPHHFVYLTALGKIAEDFNPTDEQKIQPLLEQAIADFKEAIAEQNELGSKIISLKEELKKIERDEKLDKVYTNGKIEGRFGVYNKIKKGQNLICTDLIIGNVTDKTVTVKFNTEWHGWVTKRLKKLEAERLFLSILQSLEERKEIA